MVDWDDEREAIPLLFAPIRGDVGMVKRLRSGLSEGDVPSDPRGGLLSLRTVI
jgi:hypothetical protein